MKHFFFFSVLFTVLFYVAAAFSYTTWQATDGPLNLYFGKPDEPLKLGTFTETDKPQTFHATVQNTSDEPVSLKLKFRTIETVEFPEAEQISPDELSKTLELKAKETQTVPFQVAVRKGTYSAHYPVHLDAEYSQSGKSGKTNICLVLETNIKDAGVPKNPQLGQIITDPNTLPLNILPEHGGLFIPALNTYRGYWYYDGGKAERILPAGFQGTVEESRANINRHSNSDSTGKWRAALNVHPPYHNGIGNAGLEYRIQLPKTTPLILSFFSAVRTVAPPEPPSDGVTFRVLINGESVYEKHNAETVWGENEADLSKFAGKTVLLRLESDPGPKRNTTCDSCYWGDVLLFAGEKPAVISVTEKKILFEENLQSVKAGKAVSGKTKIFQLDGGLTAAVTFGHNGFIDGVIGLGNAEKQVQFDGLQVHCKNQPVGSYPSAIRTGAWIAEDEQNSGAPPKPQKKAGNAKKSEDVSSRINRYTQDIDINGQRGTLFFSLFQNGPAVQLSVNASSEDFISSISFGPATEHADRVYFGHGYCICEPQMFTIHAGGHGLSTSHVGMDFANGLSVLQASSFPVDRFTVSPEQKLYTLSVHPSATLTLLPGLNGAMDCAVRYRPITGNVPAPGFPTKAGRFVFDVWGGQYKEHTEALKNAVQYGLTDSLFIVHNWQRWGYDNRLPDIFPPNPKLGTLEQMQETLNFCNENKIQYGIHDNYIDFYPDAEDYNFDAATFHENGQPRKAWNNYGIEAQSYQFRPDKIEKFLNRNLDLLTENLPVSSFFIDVFTSLDPVDYYDREGNFHSRAETQRHWAETFDTVRTRLSKANSSFASATTSSEAGMDSLIGHLDGADCQFMFLSPESGEFRINVKCKEWSRVPWFDAVHHNTFSLHGAGYSNRYEAQRGRTLHGIDSDDYIVSEIITGHSLMTDWQSVKRNAVRKYWLAQDLIRHLADKHIVKTEFADNNIRRCIITWSGGTQIFVNTGTDDWDCLPKQISEELKAKAVLPQYGYFAQTPNQLVSGIFKADGKIVEVSINEEKPNRVFYCNARQTNNGGTLPILPKLKSFQYAGENKFTAEYIWKTLNRGNSPSAPKDYAMFIHCTQRRESWHHKPKEAFLSGGGYQKTPVPEWKGEVLAGPYTGEIPDDLPAGKYYLVVGLYDSKGDGHRAKLRGLDTGADRYAVGWLKVERKPDGKVSNLSAEPIEWEDEALSERLSSPPEPVDFGLAKTAGAFRFEMDAKMETLTITPLPGEPATEIAVIFTAKSIKAVDAGGKELRDVPFKKEGPHTIFTTQTGEFSYKGVGSE